MNKIFIIGSSGHAKVIIDIVQQQGKYQIVGLLDRHRQVGEQTLGYSVLGEEADLSALILRHGGSGVLLAIGDNFIRSQVAERVQQRCPELRFVTAIHPKANIAAVATVGEGSVVMAGASIGASARVGRFCIVNSQSSLDHDSAMEDFSSLAPGVVTGGNCRIGEGSALGIGTVLIHGIEIGSQSVIGAGSLVLRSIGSSVVAYGRPAEVVRLRRPGDKYL